MNYVKEIIAPFSLKIEKNVFTLIEKVSMKYLNYHTDNAINICNDKKKKTLNVDHIVDVLKLLKMEKHVNQILTEDSEIQQGEQGDIPCEEVDEKENSEEKDENVEKDEIFIEEDAPKKKGRKKSANLSLERGESFDQQNFKEFINKKKKRNKNKKKVEVDDNTLQEQQLLFEKYRAEEMRQELENRGEGSERSYEEAENSENDNVSIEGNGKESKSKGHTKENKEGISSTKKQKVSHTFPTVFDKTKTEKDDEINFDD